MSEQGKEQDSHSARHKQSHNHTPNEKIAIGRQTKLSALPGTGGKPDQKRPQGGSKRRRTAARCIRDNAKEEDLIGQRDPATRTCKYEHHRKRSDEQSGW